MNQAKMPPSELFDHLKNVLESDRFLQKKGLGNEVPFFICPFSPKQSNDILEIKKNLINTLEQSGVRILDINLYDTCIEILKNRSIWDRILDIEPTRSKDELLELLRNVLDPEKHIATAIADRMKAQDFDIMFLSGIGEVFPYIRSHTVLNNLHSIVTEQPTVIFFPGMYSHSDERGASLNLFGRLQDDNYYRAFNILDYNV